MFLQYIGSGPLGDKGLTVPTVAVTTSPYSVSGFKEKNGTLYLVNATGGAITMNLPAAATAGKGFTVLIKKTDSAANAVTIARAGSDTIDGQTSFTILSQYDTFILVSDGTNWNVVNRTANSFYTNNSTFGLAGGYYNTVSSVNTHYDATASVATVYTYASAGRALVTSIQATNVDPVASPQPVDVYIRDVDTTTDFAIAYRTLIQPYTSVELLKKPKVLKQNDLIRIKADYINVLELQIVVAPLTTNADLYRSFRTSGSGDVSAYGTIYQDANASGSDIESIWLQNIDGTQDVSVRVRIYNGSTFNHLAYDMVIPANSGVELLTEPKFVPNTSEVQIKVSDADRVTTTVCGRKRG